MNERISISPRIEIVDMTLTEEALLKRFPSLIAFAQSLEAKSRLRRLEVLYERAVLSQMLGYMPEIAHDANGRPLIPDYSLSISHTRGYIALMLAEPTAQVGIDIEYRSERVNRVAAHFLRPDEDFAQSTQQRLVCWCVKEAAFKAFSPQNLRSDEILISPFQCADACQCMVQFENLRTHTCYQATCQLTADYAMAHVCA